MSRTKSLTALDVARLKIPGLYSDGNGLLLQVTPAKDDSVNKSWLYRYATGQKRASAGGREYNIERKMGLGAYPQVSLADAREAAAACYRLRRAGSDPIEHRKSQKQSAAIEAAKAITFKDAAEAYIAAHRAGWRNKRHAGQWPQTLDQHAYPVIGNLAVSAIDTGLVMKVIEPLWHTRTATASRLRGRIESILDWAKVRGYREGENPARWRGHLDKLLPGRAKVRNVKHHDAVPYVAVAGLITKLRSRPSLSAAALEFTILTAARSGEVLGARPAELDLKARVWTIPGERTKSGREHRVPLSTRAIDVAAEMLKLGGDHVFPGRRRGKPLSEPVLRAVLRHSGVKATVHGFRSSFRDWAAEQTNFPRELAEAALGHIVGDETERAYQRGDLLEKRRKLMMAWADYCARPHRPADVVPLARVAP